MVGVSASRCLMAWSPGCPSRAPWVRRLSVRILAIDAPFPQSSAIHSHWLPPGHHAAATVDNGCSRSEEAMLCLTLRTDELRLWRSLTFVILDVGVDLLCQGRCDSAAAHVGLGSDVLRKGGAGRSNRVVTSLRRSNRFSRSNGS